MERTDDDGGDVREDSVRTHVSVVVLGIVPAERDGDDGGVCDPHCWGGDKAVYHIQFDRPHPGESLLCRTFTYFFHTGKIHSKLL